MTSILTNTSSMIALQTLKSINKDLGGVQEQVSSGKKVGSAKDDAATWAISKVMESDVNSFKKIAEGLSVGASTVAVARDASETVVKLLDQMKSKIVQAQGQAQDKGKIQADIDALVVQIKGVVGAAQFNGINLINGDSGDFKVLASLDRDSNGNVDPSSIKVDRQNLSATGSAVAAVFGTTIGAGTDRDTIITSGTANTAAAAASETILATSTKTVTIGNVVNKQGYSIHLEGTKADGGTISNTFIYVADSNDSSSSVARGLQAQMETFLSANGLAGRYEVTMGATSDKINITTKTTATLDITLDASDRTSSTVPTGGSLSAINAISVLSGTSASSALGVIDGLIETATSAAATFGTAQNQLSTQSDFVGKLITSLQAGIGALIDADMEEASARLQALQTQQQLGIQSLAIANQAPAAIMALFR